MIYLRNFVLSFGIFICGLEVLTAQSSTTNNQAGMLSTNPVTTPAAGVSSPGIKFTSTSFKVEGDRVETKVNLPVAVVPVALEQKPSKVDVSEANVSSFKISNSYPNRSNGSPSGKGQMDTAPVLVSSFVKDSSLPSLDVPVEPPDAGFYPIPSPAGQEDYVLRNPSPQEMDQFGSSTIRANQMNLPQQTLVPKALGAQVRTLPVKRALPVPTRGVGVQPPQSSMALEHIVTQPTIPQVSSPLVSPSFYSDTEAQAWVDFMKKSPEATPSASVVGRLW